MPVSSLFKERRKRKLLARLKKAGWIHHYANNSVIPDGPRIYLCDIETGKILINTITSDGIRDLQERNTLPYQTICGCLGSLIGDIVSNEIKLDEEVNGYLTAAAALYIAGTESYAILKRSSIETMQFIILRYHDYSENIYLLRPSPILNTSILTPQEIEQYAQTVLEYDKEKHPERFKRAAVVEIGIKNKVKKE